MQTIIIRHKKENLKKCSLRFLETREGFSFITYPFRSLPPLKNYVMLVMEGAPLLTREDNEKSILLLDSTWRYLPGMLKSVENAPFLEKRCLPSQFRTAYPREQKDCVDPSRGLSSLEALYAAFKIMGKPVDGLLDHYYWKDSFLELNSFDF